MKKTILSMLLAVVAVGASAQIEENVHYENGIVTIDEVVQVNGRTQKQMFDNAILWVNEIFANPKSVIKSREETIGLLTLNIMIPQGKDKTDPSSWLDVSLKLQFKDGRYKYEISNIWLRWCESFHSYGAKDEKYGDWIVHISSEARATWKSDLLKEIKPIIDSMKSSIISTDNDW